VKGGGMVTEFEKIYSTYFNDVFQYIRRLSNNEHIAEEITADTFFKALRSIDCFRGECDIRVWLCTIARNCYFSYSKKQGRLENMEDVDALNVPGTAESIEEQLVRREDAMRIQRVLRDIPEPYKEVFMWRVYAELSFKQIGQIFNKSENWACVTYHRAKSKIRERLED
jgi:RNA polymerase sigma-70 factor (ECF subfamily)